MTVNALVTTVFIVAIVRVKAADVDPFLAGLEVNVTPEVKELGV